MSPLPGQRLGPYELLDVLGEGGMGEVHRARDTRLGREVAVKVLRRELSGDPGRLARFEREAKLLASVSHPNVATIHDLGVSDGVPFLVLELVPGKTLAERLEEGPLGIEEALRLGTAVAAALQAAHERGVIHRDLKPANIKITPEGRIKVLDFGIAKAAAIDEVDFDPSESPTGGPDATGAGALLGTPSYMSPEQARGREVDHRTDLWALGCVLYECLAGRRAFGGATAVEALAGVLDPHPSWDALPSSTPARIRALLESCLDKEMNRRPASAANAKRDIDAVLDELEGRGEAPRVQPRLSQATFSDTIESFPAWSPDGTEILFSREAGSVRKLFRRTLGVERESQLTQGDHDDVQPVVSPDGRSILFVRCRESGRRLEPRDVFGQYDGADVFKIDPETGKETKLVENAFNPSFSPDGKSVALDASWAGPRRIWIVDANGRNPRQVTADTSEAVAHVRPRFSPDGSKLLFQNLERTKQDVRVADVPTGRLTWVTQDLYQDVHPCWSASGRFVYFSSYRSGGLNLWRLPVDTNGAPAGSLRQVTTGPGQDVEPAISHDGKRLAFTILRQNADLWRLPVSPESGKPTGAPQKVLPTTREESRGAWSPDCRNIAFNSDRSGEMNIWVLTIADGSVRQMTQGAGGDYQPNWSPDGGRLAFFSSRAGIPGIWTVDLASARAEPLTDDASININPFHSPDGKLIAYQSDRGGRLEVWLMNADGSEPRQLTDVGVIGHFMRWTSDGRHVVFRCLGSGSPRTMRVARDGGEPVPLPEIAGGAHMSFSPDSARIMDVVGHKVLWVSPLAGGSPERVFEFDDPDVRIDYPVWSPDGRWVLFDCFHPRGGGVWVMEDFE